MAGQSITFDFLTTGADRTASGFKKVGDNAALAGRGAKILQDAIEKLGSKEGRTAEESKLLARALRETGAAEDRMTAKTVLADAAIRRLDDDMKAAAKKREAELKVKVDDSALGRLKKELGGGGLKGPGLLGPALALAPAAGALGGVAAGAAAGLGGAFIAAAGALAAFGSVAKPVLTDAQKAAGAVEKAQASYNIAIANGVKPAVAFKAEQVAIGKAYAGMSPQQIALSRQLGAMGDAWDKVKAAQTPVIAGALQPWLKSVTSLTGLLGPVIAKVAPVIGSLGTQFGNLVGSPAFTKFRDFIASTGSQAAGAIGGTLIDFVKAFITLLPQFNPLISKAIGWIAGLGPAVATWASSKKASDDITRFMAWFHQNGPVVGDLLKNIGGALKALAPGLTSGGALELKVISDFLGVVAKLPPSVAKPLFEVAGAMVILKKTGVVSVGIKLVGLGAAEGAGGVLAGLGTAGGSGAVAAGAGIAGGILLGIRHALAAGWKTAVAELPKLLEGVGSILNFSASGWAAAILDHFDKPIRRMWDNLGRFMAIIFDIFKNVIGIKWDDIKLTFFHGVQYILNIMGKLPGPLGQPFRDAAKSIGNTMGGIQADVKRRTDQIQADLNQIHPPPPVHVKVIAEASGTGTISITGSGWALGQGGIRFHSGGAAKGAYINRGTGPTADDVLIRASRGELIVPTNLVRAGAVDHLRGLIPGFAGGGFAGLENQITASGPAAGSIAGGDAGRAVRTGVAAAMAAARAVVARAAQNAPGPSSGGGHVGWSPGAGVNQWRLTTLKALGMLGLPAGLVLDVLYQMMTESGGNPGAVNRWDSNWLAGHPSVGLMQVIRGTYAAYGAPRMGYPGPVAYGVSENPLANIYAALNYAKHGKGFGTGPGQIGSGHGYARGGLVPGYASGGVAGQGAAWLKAWQNRSGGGFGAAWGPVSLNEQVAQMAKAAGRAKTLAGAPGLTPRQHRYWAATAADETRRLGVLHRELATERAWRTLLGAGDATLGREIAAAGRLPGLAGPVKGWKSQMARQKATIAGISAMLGYTDARQAAIAGAHPPPAPTGVQAVHTYGGDVANNIGTILAAALGPFTGAAKGGLVSYDRGGWLRPGATMAWNGTGRPEMVVPARGGGRLQIEWVGGNGGDDLERWIRKNVRIRGGGDVQKAYGAH